MSLKRGKLTNEPDEMFISKSADILNDIIAPLHPEKR